MAIPYDLKKKIFTYETFIIFVKWKQRWSFL